MNPVTMYLLIENYLQRLPGAIKEESGPNGSPTLLLDARVDIRKVQDLLGHQHMTMTQIYYKRRRSTAESDVPI